MPRLEKAVTRLAAMEESLPEKEGEDIPGAGAAGGVGFAALLFLSATPVSGAERILKALRLEERLTKDSLLVTGEGKIDTSSLEGKVSSSSRLCKRKGVPFLTVSGSIDRRCKERLRRLGGRLSSFQGKPAGNKADNQDKIIGALEKREGKNPFLDTGGHATWLKTIHSFRRLPAVMLARRCREFSLKGHGCAGSATFGSFWPRPRRNSD